MITFPKSENDTTENHTDETEIVENELVEKLRSNLATEGKTLVTFVRLLLDLDTNRGWARLGYSSLFVFCSHELNLTRSDAASRTRITHLCQRLPQLLDHLESGAVAYTTLRILAPVLTTENYHDVLVAVKNLTTRQVEEFRLQLEANSQKPRNGSVRHQTRPLPPPQASVSVSINSESTSNIPIPSTQSITSMSSTPSITNPPPPPSPISAPTSAPTSPTPTSTPTPLLREVRLALTLPEDTWEKFKIVCELAGKSPTGSNLNSVFERMVDEYLRQHDPQQREARTAARRAARHGKQKPLESESKSESESESKSSKAHQQPLGTQSLNQSRSGTKSRTRHIPAPVRRQVWLRDGGQCTYLHPATGHRCSCKTGMQVDHITPFARGGSSDDPANLRLLCPAHNRLAADDVFGREFMNGRIGEGRGARGDTIDSHLRWCANPKTGRHAPVSGKKSHRLRQPKLGDVLALEPLCLGTKPPLNEGRKDSPTTRCCRGWLLVLVT